MGEPVWTDSIPTAAVQFVSDSDLIQYVFNKEFWEKLSTYEKSFVISHEILHLLRNHLKRMQLIKDCDYKVANIAADLIVNEVLIKNYSFDKNLLEIKDQLCWVENILPDVNIKDHSFEDLYFLLLNKDSDNNSLDEVSQWGDTCKEKCTHSSDNSEVVRRTLEKAIGDLSELERDGILQQAGTGQGNQEWIFPHIKIKKRKWETIIKKWSSFHAGSRDIEQWVRLNRRYTTLGGNLILPTEAEDEDKEKDKLEVVFFLDVSGSCVKYAPRFFKASESLPQDKFNVKLFSFDTQVHPVIDGKVIGGGGTCFDILETYIQNNYSKYPKAIFVLTDGYGTPVSPQVSKNWYWFLTVDYKECIPSKSHIYMLSDFE